MVTERAGAPQPATVGLGDGSGSHAHEPPLRRAVLAGHTGDVAEARRRTRDDDAHVRGAALGAMARLGQVDSQVLGVALADPDPSVRRRACVLAGRLAAGHQAPASSERTRGTGGDPSTTGPRTVASPVARTITDLVVPLLADHDVAVVEAAAWALGEVGPVCDGAAVRALEALADAHTDPLCREAAVAALGAVGDPGSLDAVLRALDDRPAVRRRAAIALAAFDDARARNGLRRCLEDRDWQVRQAAEDLLEGS